MIISSKKHGRIIAAKDAEIVELSDKLKGTKKLLSDKEIELYEMNKECNKLSDELDQTKEHLKDTDIALDLIMDKAEELENENESLADTILTLKEDYEEAKREANEYKSRLNKIDDLKKQYKWYINKTIESGFLTHKITRDDVKKFISNEGIEGVMKLYMIASMM